MVSGTILDPAARTVTHLVIEPQHGTGGRLAPLDLVEGTAGEVRLGYTLGLGHRTPLVVSQAVRKQGGHPGQRRRLG